VLRKVVFCPTGQKSNDQVSCFQGQPLISDKPIVKDQGASSFRGLALEIFTNGYVLAILAHMKYVSPTFTQVPDKITNVAFSTVSPTVANTILAGRYSSLSLVLLSIVYVTCPE
jgi:hypothetical protein